LFVVFEVFEVDNVFGR